MTKLMLNTRLADVGRGAPPRDPRLINRLQGTFGSGTIFEVVFLQNMDILRLETDPNMHFFQNGSPGQITRLDSSGSKFCVELGCQSPNISHMSQNPI